MPLPLLVLLPHCLKGTVVHRFLPPLPSSHSTTQQHPFSLALIRNTLILAIPQRQIHILQTLRRRALEQIVNRRVDHDTLAARMDSESANLDAVLSGYRLHQWGLASDLYELLARIPVLVDVANVSRGHGAV